MEENFKLLGHRIKYLRMKNGISQTQMVEYIGLSQTNLSNMESGRVAITTQNLFKMRNILGCKMRDFFVDFDNEPFKEETVEERPSIELVDALQILKLLRSVNIKGL